MTKYFIPPPDSYTPRTPGVRELIEYLVSRVEEARAEGGPIFPLLISGDQGVGKSRLLAALAVELRRAGFDVYYDLALPTARGEPFDYIILDDLAALVTSWEWQTKLGRTLRKVEILIRNLGRYGYAVAAPRSGDVIKNFREKSHMLMLVSRNELKHEYGITTACDVVAVYVKYFASAELLLYQQLYIAPQKGRKYCIKWSDFVWYGDAEWRREYERVQAKREKLIARWIDELRKEAGGEELVAENPHSCAEELAKAIYRATRASTPDEAILRLLEMPDVHITTPKDRRKIEDVKARAQALVEKLGPEAAAKVAELLAAGKVIIALKAKSAIVPYTPMEFACREVGVYKRGGEPIRAYPFTIDEVIEALLGHGRRQA